MAIANLLCCGECLVRSFLPHRFIDVVGSKEAFALVINLSGEECVLGW